MWLQKRFGIQEVGVWLSIDTLKLAITVVSGFCQGIAENQWDASKRLVNQFSVLPMGWPFHLGCLSACHLSYLAFYLLFLGTIGRPRVPCWEACLRPPPAQGGPYPRWPSWLRDQTSNGGSSGMWHQEGQCSRTTEDNTINQPWRAMVMGWQTCQSQGCAFYCDIIPHLFFWSTRKTKHYKNVKLWKEKSKARKFKVNADSLTQVINSEACLKSGQKP